MKADGELEQHEKYIVENITRTLRDAVTILERVNYFGETQETLENIGTVLHDAMLELTHASNKRKVS